jgi:hypothetical protein
MAKTFNYGAGIWATKTGSSMAYNDQNDNYKPTPFSVTRDSIATRVNKQGLIEVVGHDKLRIDYTDSSNGVALLEPARQNELQYSEDFTQSEWTTARVNTPVLQTSVIAPDGSTNVYLVTNSETTNPIIFDNEIGSSTNDSTFSVFVKYYNTRYIALRIDSPTERVLFDIQGGRVIEEENDVFGTIENYGNGWFRCSITHTALTSAANAVIQINNSGNLSDNDVSTTDVGYYIFGAQYEVGSYPTSYIPTSGQSGGVTRAADVANGAGNEQVFNDSEGVLFTDIKAFTGAGGGTRRIEVSNGENASQYVRLQIANGDGSLYSIVDNGTQQFLFNDTSFNPTSSNKIALKYKQNDFSLFVNGFKLGTSNSGNTFADGVLTQVNFSSTNSEFYGKTKEIGVYDAVLTDAELEALTSYTSFTNMANELNLTIK